ncbi:MAG: 2-oxo acid dehydrogenase subunit E2 [Gammaproteobacteria bacterium]|nr:2-oxo acid dehydrogenase subunit E2 [Gammaproteobacteria bacterium]MBQ0839161.1 2-oxo acid dehydrogenase subunit E2 [Gammaproteobacteria bacterium]
MKFFKLPDLGEGLQEAEIVEWSIKAGDTVNIDQLLVTVETAKAVVEIPSPQTGVIVATFGAAGDIVHLGEPLLEFVSDESDSATVVGELKTTSDGQQKDQQADQDFFIGSPAAPGQRQAIRATPGIRALAERLQVDIGKVTGSGKQGLIKVEDVERVARLESEKGPSTPLKGVRRFMSLAMSQSHAQVVPVTINDDARLTKWSKKEDATVRLLHAMVAACQAEPLLNSWFDAEAMTYRTMETIDIGIAVDTPGGLFVPVLRDVANRSDKNLRTGLNRLKKDALKRRIPISEMQKPTISLSNFGTIAGRYANPVIVLPTVAILAAGAIRDEVCAVDGKAKVVPVMPLSLSFDHRLITGGEAARFMAALKDSLEG